MRSVGRLEGRQDQVAIGLGRMGKTKYSQASATPKTEVRNSTCKEEVRSCTHRQVRMRPNGAPSLFPKYPSSIRQGVTGVYCTLLSRRPTSESESMFEGERSKTIIKMIVDGPWRGSKQVTSWCNAKFR